MDYRIKKVGEGWEFLPQKERDEKREYENLTIRIIRREKKIESDLKKINDLKEELRDWKKKWRCNIIWIQGTWICRMVVLAYILFS